MADNEELQKLIELHSMGFILDEEFEARKRELASDASTVAEVIDSPLRHSTEALRSSIGLRISAEGICERCEQSVQEKGEEHFDVCPETLHPCANYAAGCRAQLLPRERWNHLKNECDGYLVPCHVCWTETGENEFFRRHELEEHFATHDVIKETYDTPKRCTNAPQHGAVGCEQVFATGAELANHLARDCKFNVVKCQMLCGEYVQRSDLERHYEQEHSESNRLPLVVPCPNTALGCTEVLGRFAMISHLDECRPVCPHPGCGAQLTRWEQQRHFENMHPNELVVSTLTAEKYLENIVRLKRRIARGDLMHSQDDL